MIETAATSAETMTDALRRLVATRADMRALLARQAGSLPPRVFGMPSPGAEEFLEIYIGEAQLLLQLVRPLLKPGIRLLEVGGGLGIFHLMASAEGADVVSIEPSGQGFSHFRAFGLAAIEALTGHPERFVDARVEALPWPAESFDVIVSNNVLEHVERPRQALREMYRVAAPGGRLLHHCPNYLVPYEPHYKVPVIPAAVGVSGTLIWRGFLRDPLWRSLNSINALGVARAARSLRGARLTFRNAMQLTLNRLAGGEHLSKRHGMLARLALVPAVRAVLTALPPQIMTPMIFEIEKPKNREENGC
jgi:SAM-dependent methyltransferase